ncbi:hypothetical protein Aperf_G00000084116 [Anoplocephala perfoliata]
MVDRFLLGKHFIPASQADKRLHDLPEKSRKTALPINGKEIRDFYISLFDKEEMSSSNQFSPSASITCSEHCDNSSESHRSSLLRQLAVLSKEPPRLSPLYIPHSNPGYKILSRLGWVDPAETGALESSDSVSTCTGGLGRQGQGRRLPISTVLKRDRSGVGADHRNRPRITHFAPRDVRAVENRHVARLPDRTLKLDKRYRQKHIKAERQKEILFRRELTLDDEQLRLLYCEHGLDF